MNEIKKNDNLLNLLIKIINLTMNTSRNWNLKVMAGIWLIPMHLEIAITVDIQISAYAIGTKAC